VPEVLFWFTPLSILSFSRKFSELNIKPLAYLFTDSQFFVDHQAYLLFALSVEWLGVLGLLILSIKLKKYILVAMFTIILVWLSFLFTIGYSLSHMGF
jgi:hypothetical protein